MTLDNLARSGKLKAHAADEREIARLLDSADRALKDATVATLSSDSRLDLAYRALMQAALPNTIGMAPARVQVLEAYRKARNQSDYRGIPVSDAVANECAQDTQRLLADVRAWFDRRPRWNRDQ